MHVKIKQRARFPARFVHNEFVESIVLWGLSARKHQCDWRTYLGDYEVLLPKKDQKGAAKGGQERVTLIYLLKVVSWLTL
jgi:hypothetical protein